jgi:hypothetical protein
MSEQSVIPRTYPEWRECIIVRCRQPLTRTFIAQRLAELRDPTAAGTREFTQKYGTEYTSRVIGWFEQAEREAIH